jgi:fructokinase
MPEPDASSVRVLAAGEALIDIVRPQDGTETEHVGGSPANVAVGLARLGHPTRLATHVGTDERGRRITAYLAERGVRLTPGSDSAERTPTAAATLDASGAASYEFDLRWELPEIDLAGVGHVHTGSIAATLEPGGSQVVRLVERARATATVSYDPNARPTIMGAPEDARQRVEECVGRSDVVKSSDEDAQWLYAGASAEVIAREWARLGPGLVVITRGGDGVLIHLSGTGETMHVPSRRVDVVDTVGAGDSFMAGLVSGLIDEGLLGSVAARGRLARADLATVQRAVARGIATASYTVARAGAAAPTRGELDT